MTDAARAQRPAKWTCSECGAKGEQPTKKSATHAWEHHWLSEHQGVDF